MKISQHLIALAGNPNVGKSTLFNSLTGARQKTGNWTGTTVESVQGGFSWKGQRFLLTDLPGTYSLMAHSAEEEIARNFLCFGHAEAVIIVCDATCLERNLNLVLQTLEITSRAVICVNLMDEAVRKGIRIDFDRLSGKLGVPVIGVTARKKKSLEQLKDAICKTVSSTPSAPALFSVPYDEDVKRAVSIAEPALRFYAVPSRPFALPSAWLALRLLEGDDSLIQALDQALGFSLLEKPEIREGLRRAEEYLESKGIGPEALKDRIVSALVEAAASLCRSCVSFEKKGYNAFDRKVDRLLTSPLTGYPLMFLLMMIIFWLTITGANYPSALLSSLFEKGQRLLLLLLEDLGAPPWLTGGLVFGIYRVLSWVVAVMLPPMAIFFPLFTLLEDAGFLPRVAYNLDRPFQACRACGKQALTMMMGFGCNAAGVTGCRIIDSPRERLMAVLTNSFVPCNGKFPTLTALIAMFFIGAASGPGSTFKAAFLLTLLILLGILMTFLVSWLLSRTILRGQPSSFTLELPSYRMPQVGTVLVRSVLDRTLFVLGRAAAVAAPAGLILWILANTQLGEASLLNHIAAFLDPMARIFGLDGVILMAFILGFPANEIVLPIAVMAYLSQGSLEGYENLAALKEVLKANGWTWTTALCTAVFSLMHWPCSTTLLTIRRETGSLKWTAAAFSIPTICGFGACFLIALLTRTMGT